MFYFALATTLWRTASTYWNDLYHYEECWFAAVSCMCISDFQLFRWWIVNDLSTHFCYCGTRWWNIMTLSYEQQIFTSKYTVKLMNDIRKWFFCYWMITFIKTFILLTRRDVIASIITDGTLFIICLPSSSCAIWSTNAHHLFVRPAEDFYIQTAAKTLNCDWRHFESTPRNYITLWTVTVEPLYYCYCGNPLRYVTTHLSHSVTTFYPLQRTGIFFSHRYLPLMYILPLQYPTEIVIQNV